MDVRFENNFMETDRKLLEFYRKVAGRKTICTYCILGLSHLPAFVAAVWIWHTGWALLIVFLALIWLGTAAAIPHQALQQTKNNNLAFYNGESPVQVVRFGDSIDVSQGTFALTVKYAQVIRMIHLEGSIALQLEKHCYILLAPDGFTLGNPDDFEAFLRTMCPNLKGG
jgi:hypothetical protein